MWKESIIDFKLFPKRVVIWGKQSDVAVAAKIYKKKIKKLKNIKKVVFFVYQ